MRRPLTKPFSPRLYRVRPISEVWANVPSDDWRLDRFSRLGPALISPKRRSVLLARVIYTWIVLGFCLGTTFAQTREEILSKARSPAERTVDLGLYLDRYHDLRQRLIGDLKKDGDASFRMDAPRYVRWLDLEAIELALDLISLGETALGGRALLGLQGIQNPDDRAVSGEFSRAMVRLTETALQIKTGNIRVSEDMRREAEAIIGSPSDSLVAKVTGIILDKPLSGPSQLGDAQEAALELLKARALGLPGSAHPPSETVTGEMSPPIETLRAQREALRLERVRVERLRRVDERIRTSRGALDRLVKATHARAQSEPTPKPTPRLTREDFEQNLKELLTWIASDRSVISSPIPTTRAEAAAARSRSRSESHSSGSSGFSAPGEGDPRDTEHLDTVSGSWDSMHLARTNTLSAFSPNGTPKPSDLDLGPLPPSSRLSKLGEIKLVVAPGQKRVDLIIPNGFSVKIAGIELDRERAVWTAPVPERATSFTYSLWESDRPTAIYLQDRKALAQYGDAVWDSPIRRADVPKAIDEFIVESLRQGEHPGRVLGEAVSAIATYSRQHDCRPDAVDQAALQRTPWMRLALAQYRAGDERLPLVCSGFADLYVALARLYLKGTSVLGVRTARGYRVTNGNILVRNAHDWVELFESGKGWTQWDPTVYAKHTDTWRRWIRTKLEGVSWRQIVEEPKLLAWVEKNLNGMDSNFQPPLTQRPFRNKPEFQAFLEPLYRKKSPLLDGVKASLPFAVLEGDLPADFLDQADLGWIPWHELETLAPERLKQNLPSFVRHMIAIKRPDTLEQLNRQQQPGSLLRDLAIETLRAENSPAAVKAAPWAFVTTEPANDPKEARDSVEGYFQRFGHDLPLLIEVLRKRRAAGVTPNVDRSAQLKTKQKFIYVAALGPATFDRRSEYDFDVSADNLPEQVLQDLDPDAARVDRTAYYIWANAIAKTPESVEFVYRTFLQKPAEDASGFNLTKKLMQDRSIRPVLTDFARALPDRLYVAGHSIEKAWTQDIAGRDHWLRDLQKLLDEDFELALRCRRAIASAEVFGEAWPPLRDRIAQAILERGLPVDLDWADERVYLEYEPLRLRELKQLEQAKTLKAGESRARLLARYGRAEELEGLLQELRQRFTGELENSHVRYLCDLLFRSTRYADKPEVCAAVYDRQIQEEVSAARQNERAHLEDLPERQRALLAPGGTELGIPLDVTSDASMASLRLPRSPSGQQWVPMALRGPSISQLTWETELPSFRTELDREVLEALDQELRGSLYSSTFPWSTLKMWAKGRPNQKLLLSRLALVMAPEALEDTQGLQDLGPEIEALAPEYPCTVGWISADPSQHAAACKREIQAASSVATVFLIRNALALRAAGKALPPGLELRLLVRGEELLLDEVGDRDCVLECDGRPSLHGLLSVRLEELRSALKVLDLTTAVRAESDAVVDEVSWRLSSDLAQRSPTPELAGLRETLVDRAGPSLRETILREVGAELALDHRLGAKTLTKVAPWVNPLIWDTKRAEQEFSRMMPVFLAAGRRGFSDEELKALVVLADRIRPRLSETFRRSTAERFLAESQRAFDFYQGQVMLLYFSMNLFPLDTARVVVRNQTTPWKLAEVPPLYMDPLVRWAEVPPDGAPESDNSPRGDLEFEQKVRNLAPGQGTKFVTPATRQAFRSWLGRFLERKIAEVPLPPELEKNYGPLIREYQQKVPAAGAKGVLEKARRGDLGLLRATDADSLEMKSRIQAILKDAGLDVREFPELELIQEASANPDAKSSGRTSPKEGGAAGGQGESGRTKDAR